jgi:pimeloyl-ACP methyl ester carboxylesterase
MSAVLSLTTHSRLLAALADGGRRMRDRGLSHGVYLQAIARALRPLETADARSAFLHTLRSVIDIHGQRVSATDRLYLLDSIPTLIVWGERDNTIPLAHGRRMHEAIPHSWFSTLPGVAHFPHLEDPDRLSDLLLRFVAETPAGLIEDADWGAVLCRRSAPSRRLDVA